MSARRAAPHAHGMLASRCAAAHPAHQARPRSRRRRHAARATARVMAQATGALVLHGAPRLTPTGRSRAVSSSALELNCLRAGCSVRSEPVPCRSAAPHCRSAFCTCRLEQLGLSLSHNAGVLPSRDSLLGYEKPARCSEKPSPAATETLDFCQRPLDCPPLAGKTFSAVRQRV
jgi:hypothetical protein